MSKVKISKLCIDIDGKRIELTMKQAKELSEVLNDTFGNDQTVFIDRWRYPSYPYPYYGSVCGTLTSASGTLTSWNGAVSSDTVTLTAQ
jgi:hypothetical protein